MEQEIAIIIGAGPAGLTAAYELLKRTNIKPIVIEKTEYMGGISKTVNYKENRIDIGGHRFFSKSDRVMDWWLEHDKSMLVRNRKSRIYHSRKFFDYPISLSPSTIVSLGIFKTIKIGFSYFRSVLFPIKNEVTLEDFFINRFGRELYKTFFKSYTEKLWGISCDKISASWGAQRVKGVSIKKAIAHFFKSLFASKKSITQKDTETSLIAQFLYPKLGPGQMWETVAEKIKEMGGEIITGYEVNKLQVEEYPTNKNIRPQARITKVFAEKVLPDEGSPIGTTRSFECTHVFSTMPVKDFVASITNQTVPDELANIAKDLPYRDFITVGLLVKKLKVTNPDGSLIKDNWIYIQEPDVHLGRLQIFNNWSPYMVANKEHVWIGLEYFCTEGDYLWSLSEEEMIKLAKEELVKIKIIEEEDVLDTTVIKQEKAYPAYFGTYDQFDKLKYYLDTFDNTFFIGRNGMHRYNNQDHSMLSAMYAIDNIVNKVENKPLKDIWKVNTEKEYHEER